MATGDNPLRPLFEPGARRTARVTAAVTSGRFVAISGTYEGGPLLDVSTPAAPITGGNLPKVAHCGAGAKAWGVAGTDGAADGDVIPVLRGHGMVVPMVAGANITAGVEVECDSAGKPITLASGRPCGMAESTATSGNTVYVSLY